MRHGRWRRRREDMSIDFLHQQHLPHGHPLWIFLSSSIMCALDAGIDWCIIIFFGCLFRFLCVFEQKRWFDLTFFMIMDLHYCVIGWMITERLNERKEIFSYRFFSLFLATSYVYFRYGIRFYLSQWLPFYVHESLEGEKNNEHVQFEWFIEDLSLLFCWGWYNWIIYDLVEIVESLVCFSFP